MLISTAHAITPGAGQLGFGQLGFETLPGVLPDDFANPSSPMLEHRTHQAHGLKNASLLAPTPGLATGVL